MEEEIQENQNQNKNWIVPAIIVAALLAGYAVVAGANDWWPFSGDGEAPLLTDEEPIPGGDLSRPVIDDTAEFPVEEGIGEPAEQPGSVAGIAAPQPPRTGAGEWFLALGALGATFVYWIMRRREVKA